MNFGAAITFARSALRDTAGDSYTGTDVANAVRFLVDEFCNRTRYLDAAGDVAVTTGSSAIDVSALTAFYPENLRRAYFTDTFDKVDVKAGFTAVLAELQGNAGRTGTPKLLGWETRSSGILAPVPDADRTLRLLWFRPHPSLSNDSAEVLLPDHLLRPLLWWGVPVVLRYAGREGMANDPGWAQVERVMTSTAMASDQGADGYDSRNFV